MRETSRLRRVETDVQAGEDEGKSRGSVSVCPSHAQALIGYVHSLVDMYPLVYVLVVRVYLLRAHMSHTVIASV